MRLRAAGAWTLAALCLAAAMLAALAVGRFPIPPEAIPRMLLRPDDGPAATVFWNVRLPRVAAAMLVGAALSGAGAALQGMFRNPLASPDLLGVSAGAGISLLKVLADPYNQLPAITFWLLGSLTGVTRGDVGAAALPAMAGLAVLLALRWRLNLLTLGEDEARALGVNTTALRAVAIAAATLATAAVTAMAGAVGWVGLVVPHAARLLAGPELRRLLPLSMLLGAAFMLAVDTLARMLGRTELPLGILTAVAGTPFFLWLLARPGGGRRA